MDLAPDMDFTNRILRWMKQIADVYVDRFDKSEDEPLSDGWYEDSASVAEFGKWLKQDFQDNYKGEGSGSTEHEIYFYALDLIDWKYIAKELTSIVYK